MRRSASRCLMFPASGGAEGKYGEQQIKQTAGLRLAAWLCSLSILSCVGKHRVQGVQKRKKPACKSNANTPKTAARDVEQWFR